MTNRCLSSHVQPTTSSSYFSEFENVIHDLLTVVKLQVGANLSLNVYKAKESGFSVSRKCIDFVKIYIFWSYVIFILYKTHR